MLSGDVLLRIVCDNCMCGMFRIHVWYNQKLDKYSRYVIKSISMEYLIKLGEGGIFRTGDV